MGEGGACLGEGTRGDREGNPCWSFPHFEDDMANPGPGSGYMVLLLSTMRWNG